MRVAIIGTAKLAVALFVLSVVGGCSGIAALHPEEFTENVALHNPDLSQIGTGSYTGEYTISVPPGTVVVHRSVEVRVHLEDGLYREITIRSPKRLRDSSDFSRLTGRVAERCRQGYGSDSSAARSASIQATKELWQAPK